MRILEQILSGELSEDAAIKLLEEISSKPIALETLTEFHDVLSEKMISVDLASFNPIDLCGTGGDGKNTFNISTAAAFVVAGAGIPVAKHGNYSASSICGSSNVLEELGIKFTSDNMQLKNQLDKAGICILHAPLFHPALKKLAPIRKKIGKRTIFNLLGPLLNPAKPRKQLIGVSDSYIADLYSKFLIEREGDYTIVYSKDGYDEISLTAEYVVTTRGSSKIVTPKERFEAHQLLGGNTVQENAKTLVSVLNSEASKAKTEVVIVNAAYAIKTSLSNISQEESIEMARESLSSKKAFNALEILRSL